MTGKLPPEAFEYYFSLGPDRSYVAVAEHYGVAKVTVTRRATDENWQERLRGLEQKAREKSERRIVEEMEAVRERHVKAARFLQVKALEALKTLPADQAVKAATALSIGWKHELLILGEPTDRQSTVEEVIKREYERWLMPVEDDEDDRSPGDAGNVEDDHVDADAEEHDA